MAAKPKYVVRRMSSSDGFQRHIYLVPKRMRRDDKNWSSFLRAAVYDSFEAAQKDADELKVPSYQIVPVGFAGAPYWQSKRHVRWEGPMAQYRNPQVFLVGKDGKRIEV